jgi:hypothetical protein
LLVLLVSNLSPHYAVVRGVVFAVAATLYTPLGALVSQEDQTAVNTCLKRQAFKSFLEHMNFELVRLTLRHVVSFFEWKI